MLSFNSNIKECVYEFTLGFSTNSLCLRVLGCFTNSPHPSIIDWFYIYLMCVVDKSSRSANPMSTSCGAGPSVVKTSCNMYRWARNLECHGTCRASDIFQTCKPLNFAVVYHVYSENAFALISFSYTCKIPFLKNRLLILWMR